MSKNHSISVDFDYDTGNDKRSISSTNTKSQFERQPLQSPSAYIPNEKEFNFVTSSYENYDDKLASNFSGGKMKANEQDMKQRSTSSSFLDAKGFGWLLEVDEEESDQKPLLEELDINPKDIYYKLSCVLLPWPNIGYDKKIVRDNPDFWGPLIVVLIYSLVSLYGQFRVVSWIITIWIFGSLIIFLLARVLGGEVSFSQCLGVIGYSLLPLILICLILPIFSNMYFIDFLFKVIGVIWCTYSAGSLLCNDNLAEKKTLLLYPVFLLYIYFLSLHTGV